MNVMIVDMTLCMLLRAACLFVRISDQSQKENLGIVVQYKVKVRLLLGFGSRWVWIQFCQKVML